MEKFYFLTTVIFFALFVVFLVLYLTQPSGTSDFETSKHQKNPSEFQTHSAKKSLLKVNLVGGLGNQLFQFAMGYAWSRRMNKVLVSDKSLEKVSLESDTPRNTYFHSLFSWVEDLPPNTTFNINVDFKSSEFVIPPFTHKNTEFSGHPQLYRMFDEFREDFVKKCLQNIQTPNKWKKIENHCRISVHVRRTDYVSLGHFMDLSFHRKCADYILTRTGLQRDSVELVFFSDDIDWCKSNIPLHFQGFKKVTLIDYGSDEQQMVMMSDCNHHIVPSSTFSWWGAYFDMKESSITVTTKKWNGHPLKYLNYLPSQWIVLENTDS